MQNSRSENQAVRKWTIPLVCFFAVMLFVNVIPNPFSCGLSFLLIKREQPFDAAAWQNAHRCSKTRLNMIADLVENYGLVGMDRASVYELLGTPIHESNGGRVWYYRIAPGFFVNKTYLHVFISAAKVIRYEVYEY